MAPLFLPSRYRNIMVSLYMQKLDFIDRFFTFLLGMPSKWDRGLLSSGGFPDIIESVFSTSERNEDLWDVLPLTRNIRWIPQNTVFYPQMDQILAKLEENEYVYGGAVLLGRSVLCSRMSKKKRLVLSRTF